MQGSDKTFEALQRRVKILEMMSETIKWVTEISEDNESLRGALGDHDLTRLQLMESEREREDLVFQRDSLRERLDVWQGRALALAEVLFDLERDGTVFSSVQRDMLAEVMRESFKDAE